MTTSFTKDCKKIMSNNPLLRKTFSHLNQYGEIMFDCTNNNLKKKTIYVDLSMQIRAHLKHLSRNAGFHEDSFQKALDLILWIYGENNGNYFSVVLSWNNDDNLDDYRLTLNSRYFEIAHGFIATTPGTYDFLQELRAYIDRSDTSTFGRTLSAAGVSFPDSTGGSNESNESDGFSDI